VTGLANLRDATRRLGATAAQAEDLCPYALALHVYKVRLFPQYRDPKSVIPSLGSADDDRMTSRALRSLTNQARMTSSPPATRE
jgi:hypothetical protein